MKLHIMRHGESYSNIGGRMVSAQDADLTPKGIAQAYAVKKYLNIKFNAVLSSPLRRAKQTAEVLAEDTPIQIFDDLREMEIGLLEGMTYADVAEKYPNDDAGSGLSRIQFPEGEGFECVLARCQRFISEGLSKLPKGINVLITCHGITKRVLVNAIMKRPNHHVDHLNWCDNTAFTVIDMAEEPKILHLNYFNHLVADNLRTDGFHTWGHLSDKDYITLSEDDF